MPLHIVFFGGFVIVATATTPASAPSCHINIHSMLQVNGLEFCHLSPNLLASGAGEGELCVWNLENPGQPQFCPGLQVSA